jgi:NAD(P)-dependent dehydrogenase (short-subunit alcohol dehydrogenase family)
VNLLAGRSVLVTGSSRGIGRAVAELFAREGARVALTARDAGLLRRVAQSLAGEGHVTIPADLASPDQTTRLADQVLAWCGGRLDVLVNNASVLGPMRPSEQISAEGFAAVLRVNLTAVFELTTRLIPALANAKGSIINVTSSVGREGRALWGPYAASKAGLENLTQTWAEELRERGVRVNAVNPGGTRTRMRSEAHPEEDPSAVPSPEEVAPIFLWLACDQSREVTGRSFDARGWKWPEGETARR